MHNFPGLANSFQTISWLARERRRTGCVVGLGHETKHATKFDEQAEEGGRKTVVVLCFFPDFFRAPRPRGRWGYAVLHTTKTS